PRSRAPPGRPARRTSADCPIDLGSAVVTAADNANAACAPSAQKEGGADAPPSTTTAFDWSELEGHPRKRGAAIQVVLGREGRDVAVAGGNTVGHFRRRLVEQVAHAHQQRPVTLAIPHR